MSLIWDVKQANPPQLATFNLPVLFLLPCITCDFSLSNFLDGAGNGKQSSEGSIWGQYSWQLPKATDRFVSFWASASLLFTELCIRSPYPVHLWIWRILWGSRKNYKMNIMQIGLNNWLIDNWLMIDWLKWQCAIVHRLVKTVND